MELKEALFQKTYESFFSCMDYKTCFGEHDEQTHRELCKHRVLYDVIDEAGLTKEYAEWKSAKTKQRAELHKEE